MNRETEAIKKNIKDNFDQYFPSLKSSEFMIRVFREGSIVPHHYTKKRYHAIIKGRTENGQLFEKHIFAKKMRPKLARQESKNLKELQNYELDGTIPLFFGLVGAQDILLMEYIYPAKNLLIKILKSPFLNVKNKKEIKELIKKSAIWLANFQKKCNFGNTADMDSYIKSAERELDEMPYFTEEQKEQIIRKIKGDTKNIKTLPCVFSSTDFCPRNILIDSKDNIVVVDWMSMDKTYNYYDLHYFLVNLESRKRHKLLFSEKYIAELENIFVKEYKEKIDFEFSDKAYLISRKLYLIHYLRNFYLNNKDKIFTFKKFIFWEYNKRKLINELIDYTRY